MKNQQQNESADELLPDSMIAAMRELAMQTVVEQVTTEPRGRAIIVPATWALSEIVLKVPEKLRPIIRAGRLEFLKEANGHLFVTEQCGQQWHWVWLYSDEIPEDAPSIIFDGRNAS